MLQVVERLHSAAKAPQTKETRGRRLQPVSDPLPLPLSFIYPPPNELMMVDGATNSSGLDAYSDLLVWRSYLVVGGKKYGSVEC